MTAWQQRDQPRSLWSYAGRFVLPLLLLAGAVGAWLVADRLGQTETRSESAATLDHAQTPMTSIRRMPEVATASSTAQRVDAALAALPADPGGLSCALMLLDGEPILSMRADRSLVAGYAQIFFTAHAALDVLGPTYSYETQLLAEQLPDDSGRISGSVYLIGSGDPVLMTQRYTLGFRPILSTRTAIEDLVQQVVDAGVVRIDRGVVGVERRYDTLRVLPGWPDTYASDGLVGPLSALQVNDGFSAPAGSNGGVAVPADLPATHAAERFAELVEAAGVEVNGTQRTLESDDVLPSLVPVGRVISPPLQDIVFQTLAVNDATAAELLLKELGLATRDEGTTQAGGQAVQRVLVDLGVDVPVPFRDASGLDPVGGTSCEQLATAADAVPVGHPTIDALPAYDLPGVFGGRMRQVTVESDVRMVGGTFDDTSSLVGRTVDQGSRITFASIVNRPGGPTESDLAFQQALVEIIDDLRGASELEAIEIDE